jgi:Mg-chelatase subunit ChlD
MLADLTGATDPVLRALARRLASRIVVDLARTGRPARSGAGKLARLPYQPDSGDLDLDASLEPIAIARATYSLPDTDELRVTGWTRPDTAVCLLVDRSGSMTGKPLATSAVAAAAVSWRAPSDYAVVAFAADAVVAKSIGAPKATERVVTDLLTLRGFGTTDVALALRTAAEQLGRSRAGRKITLLLSDCRATAPGDVEAMAACVEELIIIAPEGDSEEAEALGARVGARVVTVDGPSSVPAAFAAALIR